MIAKRYDAIKLHGGKFFLPKEDRIALGTDTIVIMRRGDYLLFMTEEERNRTVEEELASISEEKDLRKIRRRLFSSAFIQVIDKSGRVLIPQELRKRKKSKGKHF